LTCADSRSLPERSCMDFIVEAYGLVELVVPLHHRSRFLFLNSQKKKLSVNNVNAIGSGRPGTTAVIGFDQVHDKITYHMEIKPRGAS